MTLCSTHDHATPHEAPPNDSFCPNLMACQHLAMAHQPKLSEGGHVKRLLIVLSLNITYGLTELWGGLHTHSLALLADAGHMAADASGVVLSLLGAGLSLLAQRQQNTTIAWQVERIAASLNALGLMTLAAVLWKEGFARLATPAHIDAWPMLWIALGGLLINALSVRLFHHDHHENLNVKGAYLHMLSDLLGSVMACLSAVLILTLQWQWFDTFASFVLALLVSMVGVGFAKLAWQSWKKVILPPHKPCPASAEGLCPQHHTEEDASA